MNDSFSALHPALTFCYFAAVLLLTMLVLHPVFLALSLLGALGYCAVLRGWRSLGRTLGGLVPFLVLMAALNALFNHAGVTMLFYLPNGNPVTREALCYGAAGAAMFAAVILWFQCCNVVMTAEKYLYVFGSALPGGIARFLGQSGPSVNPLVRLQLLVSAVGPPQGRFSGLHLLC